MTKREIRSVLRDASIDIRATLNSLQMVIARIDPAADAEEEAIVDAAVAAASVREHEPDERRSGAEPCCHFKESWQKLVRALLSYRDTRSLFEQKVPPGATWDQTADVIARACSEVIAERDALKAKNDLLRAEMGRVDAVTAGVLAERDRLEAEIVVLRGHTHHAGPQPNSGRFPTRPEFDDLKRELGEVNDIISQQGTEIDELKRLVASIRRDEVRCDPARNGV